MVREYTRRKVEIQAVQFQLDPTLVDLVELASPYRVDLHRTFIAGRYQIRAGIGGIEGALHPGDWLVKVESGKLLHYTDDKFKEEFLEHKKR